MLRRRSACDPGVFTRPRFFRHCLKNLAVHSRFTVAGYGRVHSYRRRAASRNSTRSCTSPPSVSSSGDDSANFAAACCKNWQRLADEQLSASTRCARRRLPPGIRAVLGGPSQLGLDLRNRREAAFEVFRQHFDQLRLPCRHPHRLVDAAQGVLDERLILGLAQQEADRWQVIC